MKRLSVIVCLFMFALMPLMAQVKQTVAVLGDSSTKKQTARQLVYSSTRQLHIYAILPPCSQPHQITI